MVARAGVALAVALLLSFVPTVASNHPQVAHGDVIVFDHRTGNEWWVEVILSGGASGSVAKVESMDTGGPWVAMTAHPDYAPGDWAASYHIEPGHLVKFRASWTGGEMVESCWFTNPAGVEQCPTTTTSTTTTSSSSMTATSSSSTTTTTPPTGWVQRAVGDGGIPAGGDLAIGDADHDGRNEVYVANPAGLWQFQWTSNGWTRSTVATGFAFTHVAVGDVTGDGRDELFASRAAGFQGRDAVERFAWDGKTWDSWSVGETFPNATIGDMIVADVQPGGDAELYWGETRGGGIVWQGQDVNGTWTADPIEGTFFGTKALVAADTDGDGVRELYAGSANATRGDIWRIDIWANSHTNHGVYQVTMPLTGLSAGDFDGDGRDELAVTYARTGTSPQGEIRRLVNDGSPQYKAWSFILANGVLPSDVAAGDADNTGVDKIYAPGNDGHLYRVRYDAPTASLRLDDVLSGLPQGLSLHLGDGDGDGLLELYGEARTSSGEPVIQIADHAQPPRPPPAWDQALLGDAGVGNSGEDLAIGDGDRDGHREVYAAGEGLYQFKWTGSAWQRTTVSADGFSAVAVGDGDRDGKPEVYAAGPNPAGGYEVRRFVYDGAAWTANKIMDSAMPVGTMTLGDIDDDGTTELYVAMMPEYGDTGSMPSYQLAFNGGAWQARFIANVEGGARSSWVGDADRDGDRDLYVVNTGVYRLDLTAAGVGSEAYIGGDTPTDDVYLSGIVAADGDRDGSQEVYVGFSEARSSFDNGLLRFAPVSGGWDRQRILFPDFVAPTDLAFGDADNDGRSEIYATGYDGGLWRLTGSAAAGWTPKKMADIGSEDGHALVLGDADGDGRVEAYLTASDASRSPPENVYRLGDVPAPTRFDATFTGVRGNEWWEQANVAAAGGTLASVQLRINGGAWQGLTKQSWGGWAASYHAAQGSTVQFRATSSTGATDLSDCYRWIPPSGSDAAIVACGGSTSSTTSTTTSTSTSGSAFLATFSGVTGNDWWVQTSVSANQALAGVDARINCAGTWHALTKQSYGWAASFQVPAGSKVDFQARSTSGATDLSDQGYVWPNATPTAPC